MTRATTGFLSLLCLISGGLMVTYSLTAEIEVSLDTTPAAVIPAIAYAPPHAPAADRLVRVAFAPRNRR